MQIHPIQAMALAVPLAIAFHAHVRADVHTDARDAAAVMSVAQLETVYLRCAHTSTLEALDAGTAVHCSVMADALRDRGFGGSFERMLSWWHEVRHTVGEGLAQDSTAAATPTGLVEQR